MGKLELDAVFSRAMPESPLGTSALVPVAPQFALHRKLQLRFGVPLVQFLNHLARLRAFFQRLWESQVTACNDISMVFPHATEQPLSPAFPKLGHSPMARSSK
jgi:hypothetical protein